ncbi:MAG: hypothetical protein GF331_15680 [Chitinivibrionales bacterium]|nr:hypothetical protein [Chitinivibrionales bacterium]
MKIFVMTDMEGVAGIINLRDWCEPGGVYYEKGKRLLTAEVNACIDGLAAGGAEEMLVHDAHGAGGIEPELLDERAMLLRGHWSDPWPSKLDESFDALVFVGQHAKAGTPYSHITHTQNLDYIDFSINDISVGEYGQWALCAMERKVPTIFASGEKALCAEAEQLTPGVVTVSVKEGIYPDGLDDYTPEEYGKAKLGAIHLAPARARTLIREGALRAMTTLKGNPAVFRYPDIHPPYTQRVKLRGKGDTPARETVQKHPSSISSLLDMDWGKNSG